MTDLFALFDERPRPWLEPDALKETYHRLTARHHPDVADGMEAQDFAEINRAYQTLADPAARLRHLLELESPEALAPGRAVPEDMAAFFATVAEARQGAERFMKKVASASSPLAKALLSTEQYAVQERLEETIASLTAKQDVLFAEVRQADARWVLDKAAALRALPGLWQSLGYCAKWLATLRESLFQLVTL